ncbi:MAG: hypothetical protein KAS72_14530 [Phycisphaerales bacterium]|nr:hypothetical protein [Phycisphaerales bacterium]
MRQLETKPFPYYVGIYSLEELVTKSSRVCVINILGTESRKVTPVSHEFSGGNIVAGVQYGRIGTLETKIGDIPVYPSVREVMKQGHAFDVGVVYLPPSAVSQAVSELVTFNHDLKRIIIVTEKVSTADSRNIRFLCQEAGVDVIGCNCLGVANVWDHVRIGGALGGDHPDETLRPGSIAIHSNSGNFTTTIAEYLRTAGFGLSTAISSGKDLYIHFALPEFLFAAQNDPRTKAVALYVEPGGYYEKMALEMIGERRFGFNKPIVVCVTGRWKKDISRSCGHAGALAGSGDDAESKEAWFDEYFGVPMFDPKNPQVSKRGVRVASIQNFPDAMHAVFKKMDEAPDFDVQGDLELKLWLSDNRLALPKELDLPIVTPLAPYDEQLAEINKEIGAQPLRQNMRNASAASRMAPKTQVSELHSRSVLDLSTHTIEENVYFTLARIMPDKADAATMNMLLNLFMRLDDGEMAIVQQAQRNGATPNAYLAAPMAALGDSDLVTKARAHAAFIIDAVRQFNIDDRTSRMPEGLDAHVLEHLLVEGTAVPSEAADHLQKEIGKNRKNCAALHVCRHVIDLAKRRDLQIRDRHEFLLASLAVGMFWTPMLRKRITRQVVEDAIAYIFSLARLFAYSVTDVEKNEHWKKLTGGKLAGLTTSFTENAFRILFNHKPDKTELAEFQYLVGLTLTNGPGTISAKGAKESVSARNTISMAYVGFLANTGLAHGGNGFEAVEYLLDNFKDAKLKHPGDPDHNLDLHAMATGAAEKYAEFKRKEKSLGRMRVKPIPCINHPVFKGHEVNIDPREDFIRKQFEERDIYNVFLEFYHLLVRELYTQGVTRNVFCVNIDAVIAVIALKLSWNGLAAGTLTHKQVQDLVFTLFLYGRAIGVTAEITDHRDRGRDMDCRTPQSELSFVL